VDTGYMDADLIVTSRTAHHIDLIGPLLQATSWQVPAEQGFDIACFQADWDARRDLSTGAPEPHLAPRHDTDGQAIIHVV
jgi:transposase